MFAEEPLELASENLVTGDVLVFYTDGVTEAENASEEEFGVERLSAIVQRDFALSAEELVANILAGAASFSTDVGFQDDVTILVVRCDFDGHNL
jgi:sigma-B regulation protein RsbU (phosphoserine phosphatase)